MKIAMIGHKRIPSREGGIEIVVEELSTRMAKLGYDVTCYNRKGKHVLDKSIKQNCKKIYRNVHIKECFTIDIKGLSAVTSSFFGTLKILFSNNEIVHYHAEGPCVWLWMLKWFSKKKIIVTVHGLDWQRDKWSGFSKKYIKLGEKCAVKYADEIIVLSNNIKEYFENTYNRETNFIPNAVNEPEIIGANIIKKKYKLEKDDYILFLGRIVPEKGIHYLIEAFNNIKTEKKLVIAGSASDTDDYYNKLRESAKNNKNIIFTGFVQGNELKELYSNSYIYCLPSNLEGMPLSLLEAMSYGNCCLTSDIEECIEVIEDNGIVFKRGDCDELTELLKDLCTNTTKVKSYKDKAKDYILNKYNWDDIVDKTLLLYKK